MRSRTFPQPRSPFWVLLALIAIGAPLLWIVVGDDDTDQGVKNANQRSDELPRENAASSPQALQEVRPDAAGDRPSGRRTEAKGLQPQHHSVIANWLSGRVETTTGYPVDRAQIYWSGQSSYTDQEGRFAITLPDGCLPAKYFSVSHEQHPAWIGESRPQQQLIVLPTRQTATLRVRTPDGIPAEQAWARLTTSAETPIRKILPPSYLQSLRLKSHFADAEGHITLTNYVDAPKNLGLRVMVGAPGCRPQATYLRASRRRPHRTVRLSSVIHLQKSSPGVVQFVDSQGAALKGWTAVLRHSDYPLQTRVSDAAGAIEFDLGPSEAYEVSLKNGNSVRWFGSVRGMDDAAEFHRIEIPPLRQIDGMVHAQDPRDMEFCRVALVAGIDRDDDGFPLYWQNQQAELRYVSLSSVNCESVGTPVAPGPEGRFKIQEEFTSRSPRLVLLTTPPIRILDIQPLRELKASKKLQLPDLVQLSGRVRLPFAIPKGALYLQFNRKSMLFSSSVVVPIEPDGTYQAILQPEEYAVRLEGLSGWVPPVIRLKVNEQEQQADLDFRDQKPLRIRLKTEGKPVPYQPLAVTWKDADRGGMARATTDKDGEAIFPFVGPGTLNVMSTPSLLRRNKPSEGSMEGWAFLTKLPAGTRSKELEWPATNLEVEFVSASGTPTEMRLRFLVGDLSQPGATLVKETRVYTDEPFEVRLPHNTYSLEVLGKGVWNYPSRLWLKSKSFSLAITEVPGARLEIDCRQVNKVRSPTFRFQMRDMDSGESWTKLLGPFPEPEKARLDFEVRTGRWAIRLHLHNAWNSNYELQKFNTEIWSGTLELESAQEVTWIMQPGDPIRLQEMIRE